MSLLKAYKVTNKAMIETNYEKIKEDFKQVLEVLYFSATTDDNKLKAYKTLLTLYTLYGVKYLMEVSDNLNETQHNRDTMSFMNSMLVEMCYDLKLKYYVKDMSYSIVDKSIKETLDLLLDKPELTKQKLNVKVYNIIDDIINGIMASFEEQDTEQV